MPSLIYLSLTMNSLVTEKKAVNTAIYSLLKQENIAFANLRSLSNMKECISFYCIPNETGKFDGELNAHHG